MKKKYKILLIVLAVLVSGAAGVFYLLMPVSVETATAALGSLSQQVNEQGELTPEQYCTLSATITGTVGSLPSGVGKQVKAGDPLLLIDSTAIRKELEDQIASLKLQQSAVYSNNSSGLAEITLRRQQLSQQLASAQQEHDQLFGEDGTAESLIEIAEDNYAIAMRAYRDARDYYDGITEGDDGYLATESELNTLRNQASIAQQNLVIAENNGSDSTRDYYEKTIASCNAQLAALGKNDDYANNSAYAAAQQLQITMDALVQKLESGTLTAPQDGVVWKLLVQEGDLVAENQPVAALYTPDTMYIKVLVLAEDALDIQVGDVARCRLANAEEIDARVRFVSLVAEDVVSTIGLTENRCAVELTPQTLPDKIGAGYQVDVTFSTNAVADVLSVPAQSIVPVDSGSAVYVVSSGKAVLTPVETGAQRGGRVEILTGLAVEDRVVSNPFDSKIQDGKMVTW